MNATLFAIASHTPVGVWIGLAVLVGLGLRQTRARDVSPQGVWVAPIAIGAFSLWGAHTAFAGAGELLSLAGWATGVALGLAANRQLDLPRRVSANADGSFRIEGSIAPLLLYMGIFTVRYVVGAALAMQPALATQALVAVCASIAFGFPAGLLAARSRKVWATRGPAAGTIAA